MQWACDICGYIHDEKEPPETCPVCGAPKKNFSEWEEESIDDAEIDDDTSWSNGEDDDELPERF